MSFSCFSLKSATGAELNVCQAQCDAPRAVMLICHGLAEHAGRYWRFAKFLAQNNIAVVAHDHRGHGATRAPDARPGLFAPKDGWQPVLQDVLAVRQWVDGQYEGVPVVLFGHSMGASIALNVLVEHNDRFVGAAIWNAQFPGGFLPWLARQLLGWERFRLGHDVPSRLLPKLTFQTWGRSVPDARTRFDWLSHDEAEVDRYIDDPLCGFDASVSMWQDVFAMMARGADDAQLEKIRRGLAFNLIGGDQDPATDGGRGVVLLGDRLKRLGFEHVDVEILRETRHESLNELNRDQTMHDFLAWVERLLESEKESVSN